ncbi:hypothetical protein D9M71_777390 [compost metagenome]
MFATVLHFVQLQQGVGQVRVDVSARSAQAVIVELAEQGDAVRQRVAEVVQHGPAQAQLALPAHQQRQAQRQPGAVPGQQNLQALVGSQGPLGGAQPAEVIERRRLGRAVAELDVIALGEAPGVE